jgi:preprotein translocase subunit SecE
VARDRKRAKQRRQRRGAAVAPRGSEDARSSSQSQPLRADLPGALDHASGEVDEFDAALVRGAGGVPATPDATVVAGSDDELQTPQGLSGGGGGAGAAGGGGAGGDAGGGEQASGAPLRGGNRAVGFLRASWAELQRVQWPDRRQVTQATAVVLGFVAIAGAYLGVADYLAKEIVELVL